VDIGHRELAARAERPARLRRLARLFSPAEARRSVEAVARLLIRRRALMWELTRREVRAEHAGKTFGALWGVVQPLALLAVYALVYGVVFRAKIGGTFELPRNFTIYLLSGLVPWFAFLFLMAKSANAITSNAHLVKQVVFDVDALPLAAALAAMLPLTLGLGFIAVFTAATYGAVPWTYLLLPVAAALQLVAMVGFAYGLAAIGVFFRDVRDFVQLAAIVLIFLMPIVYLPGSVPAAFNPLLWLNPFTYMVYAYQDILYFGRIEHPLSWLAFALWATVAFLLGVRLFRRTRPYFANVL
jgi:lipopolysaccharide transport system permease protein